MRFEWDARKEKANIAKHGVGFHEAQLVFIDPDRLVSVDEQHTVEEPRFFCIGHTGRGVLTVRFSYRPHETIRIIGAGYWRKGKMLYEKNR